MCWPHLLLGHGLHTAASMAEAAAGTDSDIYYSNICIIKVKKEWQELTLANLIR